jgi:hypothetical protein
MKTGMRIRGNSHIRGTSLMRFKAPKVKMARAVPRSAGKRRR